MPEATKNSSSAPYAVEVRTHEEKTVDGQPVVLVVEVEADGTTHRRVYPVDADEET